MARPYPTTFDKDSSMASQSGSATPISYQANVNRQKTKKWADAKPVSYGGDDWGDDDEYDYDEPPPPAQKPTGLRQQGHTIQSPIASSSPIADNSKKDYGDLPAIPGGGNTRPRVNSFDADDEKRNFSNSGVPAQQPSAAPATRFSQITGVPTGRIASEPPALSVSTAQVGTASTNESGMRNERSNLETNPSSQPRVNSGDFQARRDYSPTAVPAPLSTRSPISQSATETPAARFPARKSSLSQVSGPNLADIMGTSKDTQASKPWSATRDSSPGPKIASPSAPTKALPFIRPADIYRRAEEERRQSLESASRPSMDSIGVPRSGERSDSPGKQYLREKKSSDSLGTRRRLSSEHDDGPVPGRHLAPSLEPVRERKSEYGFEGFNVQDHAPEAQRDTVIPGQTMSKSAQLGVADVRRQSTSPKLPDLNRMSGFGMDIFTHSQPEDTSTKTNASDFTTTATSGQSSTDNGLPRQPSIGLRSVVNQAFDRADDSSVPPTPSSNAGSNVRRDNSSSTGTGGISPIMNSSSGGNEVAPSISEVVQGKQQNQDSAVVSGFKPGHRRDISTPSPGNSPARTPDVGNPDGSIHSQQAVMSGRPFDNLETGAGISAQRPEAHSERSFRPALPGGWESYATSARTQTPQIDDPQDHMGQRRDDNDEDDLTPTTTRRALPQSALGAAAAGAAFGSGSARGTHDNDSPISSPSVSGPPKSFRGPDALPTPDLSMAPSGNLYSANTVDPRLLPTLERAPPETQLRPDVVDRSLSGDSSDAPPPPPKDTPVVESTPNTAGYFPSSSVQRRGSVDSWEVDGQESPAKDIDVAPTAGSPGDSDYRGQDENDKLQEEIVRSLSPKPSPQPANSFQQDHSQLVAQPAEPARESTYLPAEYGDYWASTDSQPDRPVSDSRADLQRTASPTSSTNVDMNKASPESNTHQIEPLNIQRAETPRWDSDRPPLKPRFSWEQSTESIAPTTDGLKDSLPVTNTAAQEPQNLAQESFSEKEVGEDRPSASTYSDEKVAVGQEPRSSYTPPVDNQHISRDAALIGTGTILATGATAAVMMDKPNDLPQRRLSLAEEKATRVSSYPVNVTPPEDEHPSKSPQPYFPPSSDQSSHVPPPEFVSPVTSPVVPNTTRLLPFKEITAIKSPQQRIQTFDETRHRFASMDSGLTEWMTKLRAQHPEHAGVTGSWAGSSVAGPAMSKVAKSPGGGSQPLQQPYYQQYLNASSPSSPSTPTGKLGAGVPGGHPQQGTSAAPTKLTSQQVQAKGKEFLHTAGIFGGKAGKAGKGLLAKGKNKLRGGGGEKSSPPPNQRDERRSSWGLPLSMSRSAGRPDSSSKPVSRDASPMAIREDARFDETMSVPSQPPQLSLMPTSTSGRSMSDSLATETQTLRRSSPPSLSAINTNVAQSHDPVATVREIRDADQSTTESESRESYEDRDQVDSSLRVPAPIGKSQPSWNPYDATPIAEETASAYDLNPNQKSYPFPPTSSSQPTKLAVPYDASKSDRSNSVDTNFHDAVEDQTDVKDDWVMVDQEDDQQEVEDVRPTSSAMATQHNRTSMMHRPRGSNFDAGLQQHASSNHERAAPPAAITSSLLSSKQRTESFPTADHVEQQPYPQRYIQDDHNRSQPQARPERTQNNDSTFLPPIRRTSTFGFKFGSRHPEQRFPIDDDDDYLGDGAVVNSRAYQDTGGRDDRAITPTQQSQSHLQNHPTSVDQSQSPDRQAAGPRRPSLVQASSSEYSQRTNEQPSEDTDFAQNEERQIEAPQPRASFTEYQNVPSNPQPNGHVDQFGYRPAMVSSHSSAKSQRTMTPQQMISPPVRPQNADDFPEPPETFRRSQDAWRPNVASPHTSPVKQPAVGPSDSRPSWEVQRARGWSGSNQNFPPRTENAFGERVQWIPQSSKAFEQPPSAAQRYPELFRTEASTFDNYDKESGDLPPHYYQPPIPREAAFLPRQQTNEYQLSGVGPPIDEPRGSPRRNSSFFKEIGGKLSRGTSRERGKSISRDEDFVVAKPGSRSQGNEDADSFVASDDGRERKNRRSGLFGLNRASTSAPNPPSSRESMIAHNPGSRTDLLLTPQPSPNPTQERKRSFFGGSSSKPVSTPKKLSRASTSGIAEASTGKKKRFSGLSGLFGKASPARDPTSDRPQATRELSYNERQPIESPQIGVPYSNMRPAPSQVQSNNIRPPVDMNHVRQRGSMNSPVHSNRDILMPTKSQEPRSASQGSYNVLTKPPSNTTPTPQGQSTRPRKSSKTRRSSTSGLLSGLMGRKGNKHEGKSDDSLSQGSRPNSSQILPEAQTYTDLRDDTPQRPTINTQSAIRTPSHDRATVAQERGRQVGREPQYDTVPIPGGYSLVRGQGAQAVPTAYDPRGLRSQPSDPHTMQQSVQSRNLQTHNSPRQLSSIQQQNLRSSTATSLSQPSGVMTRLSPDLSVLDTNQTSQGRHAPRRLSREDLIARSPARSPEGQQRPYQLSLPENDEDRDYPVNRNINTQPPPQHTAARRLQEMPPQIRHPQSPAGYPLPEDVIFSPVNPSVDDLPPPPPPKDTPRISHTQPNRLSHTQPQNSYLGTADVNRSDTHRTAVSAISSMSDPSTVERFSPRRESADLNIPNRNETVDGSRNINSLSPSPPSPVATPARSDSPDRGQSLRTTVVSAPRRDSSGLYDASPQNSPNPRYSTQNNQQHKAPAHSYQNQPTASRRNENVNTNGRYAELEGTKADGFQMRIGSQEEKIFYDAESGMRGPQARDPDENPATMSATSYPGQEWNPYSMGGYDDDSR